MQYTVEEVLKYVEEEDAKFIRLAFCDAFGVQKNISVMPGELKKAFEDGAPISAKEIAGFRGSPYAKLYLKPDPSTLAVLPWRPDSGRVLRMFCEPLCYEPCPGPEPKGVLPPYRPPYPPPARVGLFLSGAGPCGIHDSGSRKNVSGRLPECSHEHLQ